MGQGGKGETMNVKYPHIKVTLLDEDGNAFMVLGRVRKAMRRANVPYEEIEAFYKEATSGNYDHMLQTVMKTVETS